MTICFTRSNTLNVARQMCSNENLPAANRTDRHHLTFCVLTELTIKPFHCSIHEKMIFFEKMRTTTTTSPDDRVCRCTFDAVGKRVMSLLVDCVICRRSKVFSRMIKCDACRRFAHRRCIMGALNTGQRVGDLIVSAQAACGEDGKGACADAATQTSLATRDVASGDELSYVDGWSQATVATHHVACGGETICVDGCSQATVATRHVACGGEISYVDGWSQATVATHHVACGGEISYVDGWSQATVATHHVACGDETICVYGYTRDIVATCHVACGDDTVYVDGCSRHSVATSYVVPGDVTVHVDDRPQVGVATSRDATEKTVVDDSSPSEYLPRVVPPTAVATVTTSAHPENIPITDENTRTETSALTNAVDGQLVVAFPAPDVLAVATPHPPSHPIGATMSFANNQKLLRVRLLDIMVREFGPTIERFLFEAVAIRIVTPKAIPPPSPEQITAFDFLKSVWGSLSDKQKELQVNAQRLKIAPAPFVIKSKLTRLDYSNLSKEWTYGRTRVNDRNRKVHSQTIINSKFKSTNDS